PATRHSLRQASVSLHGITQSLQAEPDSHGIFARTSQGTRFNRLSDEFPEGWTPSSPVGYVDRVEDNGIVRGWTLDPDNPLASTRVHIYVDGPSGEGRFVCETSADVRRIDVNSVTGYPGNHGFDCKLPSSLLDGRSHLLYAYGIDVSGDPNALLSGSPKTLGAASGLPMAIPEPVLCYVFNDGYTDMAGPSEAIYISGRSADKGSACIPDGSGRGQCRKW